MLTIENIGKLNRHFILYEDRMLTVTQVAMESDQYVIKLRSDIKDETDNWQFNGKNALVIQRKPYMSSDNNTKTYMWSYRGIDYLIQRENMVSIDIMLYFSMRCIVGSTLEFTIYDPDGNVLYVNKV